MYVARFKWYRLHGIPIAPSSLRIHSSQGKLFVDSAGIYDQQRDADNSSCMPIDHPRSSSIYFHKGWLKRNHHPSTEQIETWFCLINHWEHQVLPLDMLLLCTGSERLFHHCLLAWACYSIWRSWLDHRLTHVRIASSCWTSMSKIC